ncbi:hypothetical protein DCO58_07065 [Helicobacter saguini]|uniref:Tetrapyrrole biosynthesis uroporphyrinogen III synthase domain-containing protein n=1 Tax=Helicobacter saguini TaxID=1548018 RepID=A0A347VN45_9HELI|nr:uroporphyrinogen-III synthase [Helicobacter saguini]MWV61907.1 hypothetical protein [Helicobacter saguini]MWV67418.1 hypothetical protein [Helicobacter saguini]MWV69771.1 hypothetical protein [Helicobacter saguini]MWV73012.1 hypothetical protein [Helicobacter saguini]TLD95610.1 hypothetical protein LS64_001790 [Helicobacter saguini]
MIYVLKSSGSEVCLDSNGILLLDLLLISQVEFDIKLDFLESIDFIILTSKSAIKVILESKYAKFLLEKKAILVGESSANLWRESGGKVAFCPNIKGASGNDLAYALLDSINSNICNIKDKNILYIKALESISDISKILKPYCKISELIVYKSVENTQLIKEIIESKKIDFLKENCIKNYNINNIESKQRNNIDSKNNSQQNNILRNLDSIKTYEINNLDSKKLQNLDYKDSIMQDSKTTQEIIDFKDSNIANKINRIDSIDSNIISEIKKLDCKDSNITSEIKKLDSKATLEIFKKDSIFIFGSPKIYRIFTKYFTWDKSYTAISLGSTTFNTFPQNIKKLNAHGNFPSAIKLAINLKKHNKI